MRGVDGLPLCVALSERVQRHRVILAIRSTLILDYMIAHTSIPVSDYPRAKAFYSKVLATLGYKQNMEYGEAAGFNDGENTDFWIGTNDRGVIPVHVAFVAGSKAQVKQFHRVALAAGATDNGAPGYRKDYWPGYYAAFVHDADGHNIEAVFYDYDET